MRWLGRIVCRLRGSHVWQNYSLACDRCGIPEYEAILRERA